MNEYSIGNAAVLSFVGLTLASWFYMLGGRNDKWLRRFISPAVITLTVGLASAFLGNFSWWIILLYPIKALEYIQGYSDNDGKGWLKRLKIALTSLAGGVLLCFIFGSWWLLVVHAVVSLGTVMFAFRNPVHAAAEEPLVCLLNSLVIVMYPFVI